MADGALVSCEPRCAPHNAVMEKTNRRTLLRTAAVGGGAVGLGVIGWQVGGRTEFLSPRDARARAVPLRTLTEAEAATLEAFGDVLLPGAREAGIALFVDHHLSVAAPDSLLTVRYMDLPPPYAPFYKGGLAALDAFAGGRFADLAPDRAVALVKTIAATVPTGWRGPPSPMLYFAVRSDAVDVVYGTVEGFEKLHVPYMAHIAPETKW